jgi:diguanylate cyclase (GGDEF)-like protein
MVEGSLVLARRTTRAVASHRLAALVALVAAAGAIVLAASAWTAIAHPHPITPLLGVIALATLLTDATCVDLRVGRQVESYTWAELILVLGLASLAPEQLVLTSLCIAVAYAATRRSPVKVVFNTASYAIGVALAAAMTHLIVNPSWEQPVLSGSALLLGAVAFSWWNGVSVDAAIAFSQDLPFSHVYRKGARLRIAFCVGNILTALVVLLLVAQNPALLLAIPPVLGVAYVVYRSYLRTIQERATWRHLETITQEINRLDETEIAEVALAGAVALFEADEAELALFPSSGGDTPVVYVRRAGELAISLRTPSRRRADKRQGENAASERAATDVAIPLVAHGAQLGVLRVGFGSRVTLSDRERQVLRTYAHTITTSLENARMYAEMREQAQRNEMAALHDPLTQLPNRVLLEERANEMLNGDVGQSGLAVMLIDLDHFKDVNDGLGHSAGDLVLRALAERLRRALRPQDTVARLGGDEFAILLSDGAAAELAAERMLALLADPIEVSGVQVALGGSIGIATHPGDGATFEELLHHADIAMYQAKRHRGAFRRYRHGRDYSIVDRLSLVAEMRTALDADQLELHFQPQFDLASNEAVGAEALVRWRHPTRGLLPPAEFIGLVESSNLLRDFTRQVLDMAVAECAVWQRAGRRLTVAVNLSARDIDDERLTDDVLAALTRHGLSPECLVLEITETAILGDLDFVEQQMARLANIGVALSIDDFGTGHSSLTFLQRVMVHELKIDRSFVAGIVSSENDAAITRATVRLAQSLGLRTVAEGVEDRAVLDALIDLRCDVAQGFFWSRPVPAAHVRRVLGVAELGLEEQPVDAVEARSDQTMLTR